MQSQEQYFKATYWDHQGLCDGRTFAEWLQYMKMPHIYADHVVQHATALLLGISLLIIREHDAGQGSGYLVGHGDAVTARAAPVFPIRTTAVLRLHREHFYLVAVSSD